MKTPSELAKRLEALLEGSAKGVRGAIRDLRTPTSIAKRVALIAEVAAELEQRGIDPAPHQSDGPTDSDWDAAEFAHGAGRGYGLRSAVASDAADVEYSVDAAAAELRTLRRPEWRTAEGGIDWGAADAHAEMYSDLERLIRHAEVLANALYAERPNASDAPSACGCSECCPPPTDPTDAAADGQAEEGGTEMTMKTEQAAAADALAAEFAAGDRRRLGAGPHAALDDGLSLDLAVALGGKAGRPALAELKTPKAIRSRAERMLGALEQDANSRYGPTLGQRAVGEDDFTSTPYRSAPAAEFDEGDGRTYAQWAKGELEWLVYVIGYRDAEERALYGFGYEQERAADAVAMLLACGSPAKSSDPTDGARAEPTPSDPHATDTSEIIGPDGQARGFAALCSCGWAATRIFAEDAEAASEAHANGAAAGPATPTEPAVEAVAAYLDSIEERELAASLRSGEADDNAYACAFEGYEEARGQARTTGDAPALEDDAMLDAIKAGRWWPSDPFEGATRKPQRQQQAQSLGRPLYAVRCAHCEAAADWCQRNRDGYRMVAACTRHAARLLDWIGVPTAEGWHLDAVRPANGQAAALRIQPQALQQAQGRGRAVGEPRYLAEVRIAEMRHGGEFNIWPVWMDVDQERAVHRDEADEQRLIDAAAAAGEAFCRGLAGDIRAGGPQRTIIYDAAQRVVELPTADDAVRIVVEDDDAGQVYSVSAKSLAYAIKEGRLGEIAERPQREDPTDA